MNALSVDFPERLKSSVTSFSFASSVERLRNALGTVIRAITQGCPQAGKDAAKDIGAQRRVQAPADEKCVGEEVDRPDLILSEKYPPGSIGRRSEIKSLWLPKAFALKNANSHDAFAAPRKNELSA